MAHPQSSPPGTDPSGQSPNPQWAGYPHQGQHQTLSSPLVSSQAQSHMSSPVSAPHARSSAYTSVAASQAQSFPNSPVSAPPAQTYKFVPWPGPYRPQQQLQQQQHLQHLQHFQQHQQPQQYQQSLQSQQQLQQYQQLQQQQHQANTPAPMIGYYHQHGSHSAAFNPYYYYDRTVAYPQLPQQQWPNASQAQAQASQAPVQAPQAPQYPPASQHPDQGTKRKRRADASSETFLKRRPWGPGEGETMDAFNFECEKRKALRLSGPDEAAAGMAAAKALATSAIKQEPYDSRPPLMERPLPMPGAYPESSGEMTHGSSGPSFKSEDSFPPSTQQTKAMPPLPPPSQMPAAPVSDEPPLCPEQADLVDLICSGRNVFYTGSAGCGKSTVLKAFTRRLRDMGKKVRILAPTGRAALQVNGQTFWTFAGWTPGHLKQTLAELKEGAHGKFVYERIKKNTDVIVFDEISMVENHIFERLNELMKEAWHDPKKDDDKQPAFGGVQVIVTGDFCQLPPVKPFQYCMECGLEMIEKSAYGRKTYTCPEHRVEYRDEHKWAFSSKAWQECNFEHVHLKQIHRQNDQEFIRMLQKCRIGDPLTSAEVNRLMDHPCKVHNGTSLFATREQARQVNEAGFKRLTGVNYTYWAHDTFVWNQNHPHLRWKGARNPSMGPQGTTECRPIKALDDHRFADIVELKRGMLVVLLANLDLGAGLCNGSQGIVKGFERYDPKKMPRAMIGKKDDPNLKINGSHAMMREKEMKIFIEGKGARFKQWPVVIFHNGQTRIIHADCSISELGDKKPYSLLSRTQIPLAPAWAMTIHKSQSLTMDRVIVDLSRTFEEGQVYVALSRATGLSGLKINGDTTALTAGLGGNREVQRFLREKFGALNALMST